jgi:hypothetical protein
MDLSTDTNLLHLQHYDGRARQSLLLKRRTVRAPIELEAMAEDFTECDELAETPLAQ